MDISPYTLLAGVMLGFASTLHCAGMCGGIATSMVLMFDPRSKRERARILALAQAGRMTSYVVAGGILGFAGAELYGTFNQAAAFRILQWIAAAVLMWVGLSLAGLVPMPAAVDRLVARLSAAISRALAPLRRTAAGPYLTGLTWGVIPCPMVYGALFTAMLTGSALGGMALMAGFGLATLPAVSLTAFGISTLARAEAHGLARTAVGLAIAVFAASTVYPGSPTAGALCLTP